MRIFAYIDGFNLYYGARALFMNKSATWKWLDLRNLCQNIIQKHTDWNISELRIIYFTARISGRNNPHGQQEQDVYLRALQKANSVDHIVYGNFMPSQKSGLLLQGKELASYCPEMNEQPWFEFTLKNDSKAGQVPAVRVQTFEEKGTDVNLSTHLMHDTLTKQMDAALVITNDSDFAEPINRCRQAMPVCLVNPGKTRTANALKNKNHYLWNHYEVNLETEDLVSNQLPLQLANCQKPTNW